MHSADPLFITIYYNYNFYFLPLNKFKLLLKHFSITLYAGLSCNNTQNLISLLLILSPPQWHQVLIHCQNFFRTLSITADVCEQLLSFTVIAEWHSHLLVSLTSHHTAQHDSRGLGGVVVRESDLQSTGCEFDSRPCTARLVLGWVPMRAGKPPRYITGHLGQLSLSSLRGR